MLELRDANDVGDLESVTHLTSLISHEDEAVATFSVVEHGGFMSDIAAPSACGTGVARVKLPGFCCNHQEECLHRRCRMWHGEF